MSESNQINTHQPTIVYGSGRKPDAAIPRPGTEFRKSNVAVVVTDLQKDFFSPEGVTWGVVGQNVTDNNTVENIGRSFAASKGNDVPLFISPHYHYPQDHRWQFEGALVGDSTATAQVPHYDGYEAAMTSFPFLASVVWSASEATERLSAL